MTEAQEIMRLSPAEGLDLAVRAKAGAPSDVRAFVLYSAWRNLMADRYIPTKKKPSVFTTICKMVDVEIVNG